MKGTRKKDFLVRPGSNATCMQQQMCEPALHSALSLPCIVLLFWPFFHKIHTTWVIKNGAQEGRGTYTHNTPLQLHPKLCVLPFVPAFVRRVPLVTLGDWVP